MLLSPSCRYFCGGKDSVSSPRCQVRAVVHSASAVGSLVNGQLLKVKMTGVFVNTAEQIDHPLIGPPFALSTRAALLRQEAKMFLAVFRALAVLRSRRTLSFITVLCTGNRPAFKSFKSICLSHKRNFAQSTSTGLRSGDLGGTCQSSTRAFP